MDDESGSKNNLFDPVQDALDEIKSGARAGLDVASRKKSDKNNSKNASAASGLKSAEKNAASGGLGQMGDNLASVRENESSAGGGLYSGIGKKVGAAGGKGKGKGKGFFKKSGPIGAIFGLILGVGALMGGSQLFQPFSLIAQFQETFNSMQVSANMRSSRFFRLQMDSGRVKNPIRGTIFGKTFKITKKQQEKLKQHGIEYDDDFGGKRVLKFDDGSGEIKIITADAKTAKALGDIKGVDSVTGKAYSKAAISFDEIYSSNTDFHHAYNTGSMTWRGQIANWFGTRVAAFLSNNKLTRNMFDDYDSKKTKLDGDGLAAVKETLEEKTKSIDNEGEKVREAEEGKDSNGNPEVKEKDESGPADSSTMSRGDTDDLGKKMDNIKNKFSSSVNWACGVSNAVGAITMAVTAAEALQIINLATAYFETVDKVKAGNGDDAPIHELSNALNEKKTTTDKVLTKVSMDGDGNSENDYKGEYSDELYENKSAMESEGIAALYSGGKVNSNDASVQSFNLTASIKNVMWGIGASMTAFKTCTIAKMTAATVETGKAIWDLVKCIGGIVTSETGVGLVLLEGCAELVGDIGMKILKGVAVGVVIAGVFSVLAPVLTGAWTRDLVSNLGGVDLGNALASGGNMYLGGAHRANGGSPATEKKYKSYAVAQHQVMEDYARYEREDLSPFDTTSKYTFMGTLLTQLMNFTSASSLMGVISSSGSAVSNSVVALSPTAMAYDIAETLPNMDENASDYYGNTCPYLASIGVVGDAYCNPYVMTDMDTIGDDPADVIDTLNSEFTDQTTSDGNVEIDGGSDLAKYIRYCDGRNSMFGITDYNIVSSITSSTSADTGNSYTDGAVDGAIGTIPLIGDGIDIVENATVLNHLGYISGESCVAGNTVNDVSAPNWDKAKYYQRFIEDQSLAESMGVVEKSAVTAYLEEYYKENPLDNSYEGMLARYSGLDKETISDILYIARYYEFVNNYNPDERYAFGVPVIESEKELKFDNENKIANNPMIILVNRAVYADVRNRNFAA